MPGLFGASAVHDSVEVMLHEASHRSNTHDATDYCSKAAISFAPPVIERSPPLRCCRTTAPEVFSECHSLAPAANLRGHEVRNGHRPCFYVDRPTASMCVTVGTSFFASGLEALGEIAVHEHWPCRPTTSRHDAATPCPRCFVGRRYAFRIRAKRP